jgi:hypothetical protein
MLLIVAYKILSDITYDRLLLSLEKETRQYQYGFRTGKPTTGQVFNLKQLFKKLLSLT